MHYYSHHIGDFRSGTVNMSRLERWIYRDMLDVYYDAEKPLPLDFDVVCDKVGACSDEEQKIVAKLLRFKFNKTENGYEHERCDAEIAAYHKKQQTASENGKLGGRPKKADGNPKKPSGFLVGSDEVSTANLGLTELKTNQEPITNNHKPRDKTKPAREPRFDAQAHLETLNVAPKVISDWLAHRKAKRASVTETVIDDHGAEAAKAGISLEAALKICCSRGWTGFNAEWNHGTSPANGARASPQAPRSTPGRHSGFNEIDYHEGVTADGVF